MRQPKAGQSRPRKLGKFAGSPLRARLLAQAQVDTRLVTATQHGVDVCAAGQERFRRTFAGVCILSGRAKTHSRLHAWIWPRLKPQPPSRPTEAFGRSAWPTRRPSRPKLLRAKLKRPAAAPDDPVEKRRQGPAFSPFAQCCLRMLPLDAYPVTRLPLMPPKDASL